VVAQMATLAQMAVLAVADREHLPQEPKQVVLVTPLRLVRLKGLMVVKAFILLQIMAAAVVVEHQPLARQELAQVVETAAMELHLPLAALALPMQVAVVAQHLMVEQKVKAEPVVAEQRETQAATIPARLELQIPAVAVEQPHQLERKLPAVQAVPAL